MNKPTQEQIKEFWKWCGWKTYSGLWEAYPELDLNNLFKYAVPKLPLNYDLYLSRHHEASEEYHCSILCGNWTVGLKKLNRPIFIRHGDPALALFWAIEEVVKRDEAGKPVVEE